jgi:hypothetical protein
MKNRDVHALLGEHGTQSCKLGEQHSISTDVLDYLASFWSQGKNPRFMGVGIGDWLAYSEWVWSKAVSPQSFNKGN